jgi:putative FmdB family regulatory protein
MRRDSSFLGMTRVFPEITRFFGGCAQGLERRPARGYNPASNTDVTFFGRARRAMPTYTYQCDSCGHGFEAVQRFADDPLTECPQCGASIRRVIQPVGVVFKGSGWYITDSRPKSSGEGADGASTPAKAADKADAPAKGEKAEKPVSPAKTDKSPAKVAD